MELGLYHPVNLSGLEMLVKTENGSDCMASGEAAAQSPVGGASSAHAVTGEIAALFFLPVSPCSRVTLQSVESKKLREQHGLSIAYCLVCIGTYLGT